MHQINLPFHGQPSKLPLQSQNMMGDFLRSDHVSFWDKSPSLSAVFLSDTANLRGYMVSCYHENCDSLSHVTPKMLQFLQKTSDTILATANDVTKVSCGEAGKSKSQVTTGKKLSHCQPRTHAFLIRPEGIDLFIFTFCCPIFRPRDVP